MEEALVDLDPDREDRRPITRPEAAEQLDTRVQRRAAVDPKRFVFRTGGRRSLQR